MHTVTFSAMCTAVCTAMCSFICSVLCTVFLRLFPPLQAVLLLLPIEKGRQQQRPPCALAHGGPRLQQLLGSLRGEWALHHQRGQHHSLLESLRLGQGMPLWNVQRVWSPYTVQSTVTINADNTTLSWNPYGRDKVCHCGMYHLSVVPVLFGTVLGRDAVQYCNVPVLY